MEHGPDGAAPWPARPSLAPVVAVRFHLHARLLIGSLAEPKINDLQTREHDDWDVLVTLARELVSRGFTVHAYEHAGGSHMVHEADYRCVREWRPGGPSAGVPPAIYRPEQPRARNGRP